jgi:hypothetical protein
MSLFGYIDLYCCAQHVEAKQVANKLHSRYHSSIEKLHESVTAKDFDVQRFEGCAAKSDKIGTEFHNIMRGLAKCCSPFKEPCWIGEG